ncbi:eukaryotic translation initiation factor 2D [Ixodes scapularis]|uniref:eukaryotic translation initiation factor 2D n=1 Tax=Ixodes scapularis TaxID=6945 RepID=UPI001C383E80|nr:eukaryotic translation initiation factor 2D [Ixodes scapularis]
MFVKQFRIKSNVRLKNSDRKKLRSQIEAQFPQLSAVELDALCPPKEDLFQLKLMCHAGDAVIAYCLANEPMFFEQDDGLLPTVYALWCVPSLLPYLTTWDAVLERLSGGADLMAPGIGAYSEDFVRARPGDPIAVRLSNSGEFAVAVGSLLVAPESLMGPQRRGKAVAVAHVYGDYLWAHGSKRTLPKSERSTEEGEEEGCGSGEEAESPCPTEGSDTSKLAESLRTDTTLTDFVPEAAKTPEVAEAPVDSVEAMDVLLESCMLSALRSKLALPVLASTLYSTHVLPRCPPGRFLDLKRTSHKKLSSYLAHLQNEGLLVVRESSPGVQSIVSVQREHPRLRTGCNLALPEPAPDSQEEAGYTFPQVRELRTVTAAVKPLFPKCSKGDALAPEDVRAVLRNYVKENELQDPTDKRMVQMDPTLSDVAGTSELRLSWEELGSRVMSRMQFAHEVRLPGREPVVHRGALAPIAITVAQRTGNKKVTLVEGLETYGIDPQRLAHEVQVGVAASTSLTPVSRGGNKQVLQLLVQGNQVVFLERLLTGPSYGVPRRLLKGLENAPTKKKQKAHK